MKPFYLNNKRYCLYHWVYWMVQNVRCTLPWLLCALLLDIIASVLYCIFFRFQETALEVFSSDGRNHFLVFPKPVRSKVYEK